MNDKKLQHVERRLTDEERARHDSIREAVEQEFPPKPGTGRRAAPPGIPARIRAAREAQNLTWHALAKLAGIADQNAIRDMEQGKDVKVSDLQRIAAALGLKLELVEEVV